MLLTSRERRFCQVLKDLPEKFGYRYTSDASRDLQQALFRSLVAHNDIYLQKLFNGHVPRTHEDWNLRRAQGMVEGAEYTEAARGKRCGHIFKSGEATYRCKTCTLDDTCVLCSKCFEASDHAGHMVYVNISPGNSGCCDCGDAEAWKIPVKCAIHTAEASTSAGKRRQFSTLPDDLVESIKMTVGRAFDYMCDVISCSPEQLRLLKTEDTIRQDEQLSHLASKWYEEMEDSDPEFALVLWNDEKHTVDEVQNQVARACKMKLEFGLAKANETNDVGRSVVEYSRDVRHLLKIAKTIEAIKITVTIRSSRDTFREQMCGTIIEWLVDVSGCSVGEEHDILRQTMCQEMLKVWRTGSGAANSSVGRTGLDDHEIDESAELSDLVSARRANREHRAGRRREIEIGSDSDDDTNDNDNDNDDGDDEADSQTNDDEMELDLEVEPDRDLEMRTPGDPEDETEVSEATYAGYPPPPPPPPAPPQRNRARDPVRTFSDSDSGEPHIDSSIVSKTNIEVPRTPWQPRRKVAARPPGYWLEQPEGYASRDPVPLHEDLRQRVRLDWMILFDLRLWKKARIDLRDLYIGTVVTVPQFKRILGLRFAGLYTVLAQLYLIADREPDHSIINLSLQMLTTPSITEEIVERGNFLTNLMAILYTFLTSRQVGHPWEMQINATLAFDAGSVTNRRLYHFFLDLKYLFGSGYIQQKLRTEERYVLQFLDLIRLPQGICPNVRAVGDHVEYETDAWIGASLLTREINKLCRQFAESFKWQKGVEQSNLSRVIRTVAKAAVVNAIGAERVRFDQAEIKTETRFKKLQPFEFDASEHRYIQQYSVVDFVVEKEPISFHHALHYTLSWLIDCGKSMSCSELRDLLRFNVKELKEPPPYRALVPDNDAESYLMALFDSPLRVCAWLAQMKAGMWVRNGLSLRHQMGTYRGVSHRDLAHHRDIFLLQTALVICNPSRVLASMIERFGMDDWMRGNYVVRAGYEPGQLLDVAEDFIHLMIVLLCDRTSLHPLEEEASPQSLAIRRDIAHILCFKPLSYSDLSSRLADKFLDLEEFQQILEEMTNFRAPEGLSDSGTFELKQEYLSGVDPYIAHYSKNQRDEAENAYRTWTAKRTGKPLVEVVLEPKLRKIETGVFKNLSSFTRTPLFAQIMYYSLMQPLQTHMTMEIPNTRVEAFLQVVLHLMLTAVLEDDSDEDDDATEHIQSFVHYSLCKNAQGGSSLPSIFTILIKMLGLDEIKGCHPKIRLIMHRLRQRRPRTFTNTITHFYASHNLSQAIPLDILGFESPRTPLVDDQDVKQRQALELQEAKKQQALARQAKVMAQFQQQQQNFLDNQDSIDWGEDDFDDLDSVATGATEEHKKMWKYPTGNCILCQEETNDTRLYGTFAHVMNSNILRQTDLHDPDLIRELLSTPTSLDRSAESMRPFGLARQNRRNIRRLASDGQEIISEHQGLGRGFPPQHCLRGPVSSGCGHIMHYTCFELYCSATQRRQHNQIARNHPERIEQKEFVCPLCKALGNTFLPIIWRGKEELYPGALQTELSFKEWLDSSVGLAASRFHKRPSEEAKSSGNRYQELFVDYMSRTVIPPLASRLPQLVQSQLSSPTSPLQSSKNSMPGLFASDEGYSLASPSHPPAPESLLMDELVSIYDRLRDSIKSNGLPSRFSYPAKPPGAAEDLTHTDTLARTLGFSIAATEIAQRGVQSEPGSIVLDKIPTLALVHLRMLSETASSYIAIGGMRNWGSNSSAKEFSDTNTYQLFQLFAGHPKISGPESEVWSKNRLPSALMQDAFIFLAECSVCLVPAFNLDILHVVHLCYLLELVRVVLNLITMDIATWPNWTVEDNEPDISSDHLQAFYGFIGRIRSFLNGGSPIAPLNLPLALSRSFYRAVSAYALPFLRKTAILLHVRYGIDFPDTGFTDIDEPELDRLSKALRLPSLPSMFAMIGDVTNDDLSIPQMMVAGWIEQCNDASLISLKPSHPGIFELIGLPKHYDTLTHETMKRRCPTTGKDLVDPSLCLFCGDIFCSQAQCCQKEGKGGCNQHMRKCGIDVGLFLNIRKCTLLYLHCRNGSWNNAPYLDKHGEVDPGLRRNRQLFLHQKRYDALLRNVWLQHGIPTTISRKLEADINNGGWETL
ncbi:hypothetical protein MMC07_004913 [Pseudocyphellaria aurata]|nr:hypothetical protein [Pseudocyphellaria aurata]